MNKKRLQELAGVLKEQPESENEAFHLVTEIYEGDNSMPVVTHVFSGKTKDEAQGYFDAHKKTDTFFAQCVEGGQWGDVECYARTFMKTSSGKLIDG